MQVAGPQREAGERHEMAMRKTYNVGWQGTRSAKRSVGCQEQGHTQCNRKQEQSKKSGGKKTPQGQQRCPRRLSAVRGYRADIFRLYREMRAARHDGAACNLAGWPAALGAKQITGTTPTAVLHPGPRSAANDLREFCVYANQQSNAGEGN